MEFSGSFKNAHTKKTRENETQNSSSEFVLMQFKPEMLNQYQLPNLPCPVRCDVLETILQKGPFDFSALADELSLYLNQNPDERERYNAMYARLSYLAGVNAGSIGDDNKALKYLRMSYDAAPEDMSILRNYALALSKTGQLKKAVDLYEKAVSMFPEGGISPEIWTETVELHNALGHYRRALELVEQAIEIAPDFLGDGAKRLADDLRAKLQMEKC